jgi:hypothetical protein
MDRRIFLTGLMGVGAATAVASVLPRPAQALIGAAPGTVAPMTDGLPDFSDPELDSANDADSWRDNIELVDYKHRHRRRRRVRRWRNECRRHWYHGYWRRRCHRVPYWAWIWFWL